MLRQEVSLTQNVKSRTTRHNVLDALEKIINHLRVIGKTPENGLVVFCGNISEKEGQSDIELWSLEPPQPLSQKIYWCDQKFKLDPIKDMIREKEIYGLIVLDTSGADIGFLKGKKIILQKHIDSLVPGKTRKGGWSQQRYSRIREEAKHEHLKKTGEIATSILKQEKDLKGILIGGPGPIKEKFNEGDFLDYQLKQKVLGVVDTSYIGDQGLQELVKRSENLLQEASVVKERKLMESFFEHLQKDDGLSIYGLEETKKAIESGAVDILLISEDFNWKRMKVKCQCGFQMELDTKTGKEHKCPKCGGNMIIEIEQDLADILAKQAKELGSKVEIISSDSREGAQFAQLGGIGAILRYRVD